MSERVFNFGAGPYTLPLEVLQEAQAELVNFRGAGMSILEASHRGKLYEDVHNETISLLKELYAVPEEFELLFIQGGAHLQFSMIPMNILPKGKRAGYIVSGSWSKKSYSDAKNYGDVYLAWDGKDCNFTRKPKVTEINIEPNTDYLYLCSNETVGGIRFAEFPNVSVPIVADMSSDYMSRAIPWEKFDLVYGGVQKNLGPSGMAIVFIRKTRIETANKGLGSYLSYENHAKDNSLHNTPPVFFDLYDRVSGKMDEANGRYAGN